MLPKSDERRNPFVEISREPVEAIRELPAALARSARARKSHISPSEKRRHARMTTITFSDESVPDRLRALAVERGLLTAAGQPNVSALVEPWILAALEDDDPKLSDKVTRELDRFRLSMESTQTLPQGR